MSDRRTLILKAVKILACLGLPFIGTPLAEAADANPPKLSFSVEAPLDNRAIHPPVPPVDTLLGPWEGGDDFAPRFQWGTSAAWGANGTWLAVWHHGDLSSEVLALRSTDNGATWTPSYNLPNQGSTPMVLSNGTFTQETNGHGAYTYPRADVATNGSGKWLAVWESTENMSVTASGARCGGWTNNNGPGPDRDIFFARSFNDGVNWNGFLYWPPPGVVNNDAACDAGSVGHFLPDYDWHPQIEYAKIGATEYWVVVWHRHDKEIRAAYSTDFGENWSNPVVIDSPLTNDVQPAFAIDDRVGSPNYGLIVVVWQQPTTGIVKWSYAVLPSFTFAAPITMASLGQYGAMFPDIATDENGNWMVVYEHPDAGDNDIYQQTWTAAAQFWSTATQVNRNFASTSNYDKLPKVETDGNLGTSTWLVTWGSNARVLGPFGLDSNDQDILAAQLIHSPGAAAFTPAPGSTPEPYAINSNYATDTSGLVNADNWAPHVACDRKDPPHWVIGWHAGQGSLTSPYHNATELDIGVAKRTGSPTPLP